MTADLDTIKQGASFSVPVRLHPVVEGVPVAYGTAFPSILGLDTVGKSSNAIVCPLFRVAP